MAEQLNKTQIRNIVFNMYGARLEAHPGDFMDTIRIISKELRSLRYSFKQDHIREHCVEYLLENVGVSAFDVAPTFKPPIKSKSVPEILNELVAAGKISKYWKC